MSILYIVTIDDRLVWNLTLLSCTCKVDLHRWMWQRVSEIVWFWENCYYNASAGVSVKVRLVSQALRLLACVSPQVWLPYPTHSIMVMMWRVHIAMCVLKVAWQH